MANIGASPATPAGPITTRGAMGVSFVEWGPVIAGALLAAALSFVLLTFGSAIGLSATSPWPNTGLSAKVLGSIAIFWVMAQQIGSLMVGGYVAGRMRTRWHEASQDEAEFRDGLHGALVWAVGVVISALLVMTAAGAIAQTGAQVAGGAAAAAAAKGDPMDAVIDTMVRPASIAQAGTAPAAGSPPAARARTPTGSDESRAEISRILAASAASGSISNENRTYLAQLISSRAGISQQEAEKRVKRRHHRCAGAADKASHAPGRTGSGPAGRSHLVARAAWWAAMRGGHHRDNAIPARFPFEQRRRMTTS